MTDPKTPEDEAPETHPDNDAETQDTASSDSDAQADAAPETAEAESADPAEADAEAPAENDAEAGNETNAESEADSAPPEDKADDAEVEDGTIELTEAEKLEIAEAALRDAERGLTGDTPETSSDTPVPETAAAAAMAAAAAAQPTPSPTPPPAAQREVIVERKGGGFVPGFLGGVVAVVGAAFAVPYVLPESMRPVMTLAPVEAGLSAQSDEIAGLADEVAGAAGNVEALTGRLASVEETAARAVMPDALAALDARLGEIQSALSTQSDELSARVDALASDFANFERSPLEDSTDPAVIAALASYARDVQTLRDEVAAQTAENTRVIEEAAIATAEARAAAEAEQQAAAERAALAAQQQALVDIKSALESGAPFADPLTAFGGDAPEALSAAAAQGVATLASLQASFAAPARDALDAARRANVGDAPAERGMTFLQTQLGMRSLAPRDGDSADAILSRAEAATASGDLATALSELGALPDAAAAPMADWIARASARADAIAAADDLAQSSATN